MADDNPVFSYEIFAECVKKIVAISDKIQDGWELVEKKELDNGLYMKKKVSRVLTKHSDGDETTLLVVFEYHVAYNISYGVPILCFVAWKQDGTVLQMEEYCGYNKNFGQDDMLSTLTQLDHPVLCRPFLTLHPCRTREIMETFSGKSKNLVVSWLSVIGPFLDLKLEDGYVEAC